MRGRYIARYISFLGRFNRRRVSVTCVVRAVLLDPLSDSLWRVRWRLLLALLPVRKPIRPIIIPCQDANRDEAIAAGGNVLRTHPWNEGRDVLGIGRHPIDREPSTVVRLLREREEPGQQRKIFRAFSCRAHQF